MIGAYPTADSTSVHPTVPYTYTIRTVPSTTVQQVRSNQNIWNIFRKVGVNKETVEPPLHEHDMQVPEMFRFWELTRINAAAWGVAGIFSYYFCAINMPSFVTIVLPQDAFVTSVSSLAVLRDRWYPAVVHNKATEFTPKEVTEWNQYKSRAEKESDTTLRQ